MADRAPAPTSAAPPLALDAEAMRALGYATVDFVVEYLTRSGDPPALRYAGRRELEDRLRIDPPEQGTGWDALLGQLQRDVVEFAARSHHPGYFAYIPTCGTFPSALGDFVASALDIEASAWVPAAGPVELEVLVLDWFAEWIGYPPTAAGVLTSGGSAANLTALACAREARIGAMTADAVIYVADQGHSSVVRAARTLGFRPDQVRVLPVDDGFRLRTDAVVGAMDADLAAGRVPLLVSAAAGSTNTGAIDPLADLAAVCRDRGVWLHVDAAYGGFAALTERGRALLSGIEQADSVTLDPHKWLYQPVECGSLLVREGHLLRDAFEIVPDYLRDTVVDDAAAEVNFADRGLQLSRSARALKLWLSLRYFGVAAFRAAIDRAMDLARAAQRRIEADPDLELLAGATLGVVCFRRRVPGADEAGTAAVNAALLEQVNDSGMAFLSSTRLRGRYCVRLAIMNFTSTQAHVDRVLDAFAGADVASVAPPAARTDRRDPGVSQAWLAAPVVDAATIRGHPLFATLDDRTVAWLGHVAREERVGAGTHVVDRWSSARDFHAVVEGTARVSVDDARVRDLRAGDFFGELAALDWGAGYGYVRLATVEAVTDLRLLTLSSPHFNELLRISPEVSARVDAAVRERLPRA
ncbi:MAG TPA: aminotransferase class V-fold PLP-dependent enzyme [Euzebyales bacterium]|nr:aminotransferase class V-fold PLP-dependent enzyme [Euzebyales bacterium]